MKRCLKTLAVAVTMGNLIVGCASRQREYITPDHKEYTMGGIFKDKYFNSFSGGEYIMLHGIFGGIGTKVVRGLGQSGAGEHIMFHLNVAGGLHPIEVYATREVAPQLFAFKQGDMVTVYGETLPLSTHEKDSMGYVSTTSTVLAVRLHKIAATP